MHLISFYKEYLALLKRYWKTALITCGITTGISMLVYYIFTRKEKKLGEINKD